mmetsp:Transcript_22103/g.32201  ORF Transcript_22103/g.32201 Transcript_22103/m.32201 type:complete len:255 (-) Transcript_22103:126-890(-)
MSNLAALSSSLRQKDSEKTGIINNIKDLEGIKAQNVAGQLTFVVNSLPGRNSNDYTVDLSISPADMNMSVTKLNDLAIGTEVELQLKSKAITITITVKSSSSGVDHTATFDVNDVPDNNSMSTDLDGNSSEGSIKVHVKATYDTMDGLIASKQLELKQVEQDIKKVAEELRGATQKQSAPPKQKKSKKQQAQTPMESAADFNVDEEGGGLGGGLMSSISQGVITAANLAINHRAVVLFGLAVYGVFMHGDVASV